MVRGQDKMYDLMDGVIKNRIEVDSYYKRGQLKRFYYTDATGHRHRFDYYEKIEGGTKITNPYVFRWIKNDLIANKDKVIYNPLARKRLSTLMNRKAIEELPIGTIINHTDMSHCYVQISKKIGYISSDTHDKLVKRYDKAKNDICIAFTTAFSEETMVKYVEGRQCDKKDISNYELEHVLENICYEVFMHVNYLYENFPAVCLGYMVDCVYSLDSEVVEKYFTEQGIQFKTKKFEYFGDGNIFHPEHGIKKIIY